MDSRESIAATSRTPALEAQPAFAVGLSSVRNPQPKTGFPIFPQNSPFWTIRVLTNTAGSAACDQRKASSDIQRFPIISHNLSLSTKRAVGKPPSPGVEGSLAFATRFEISHDTNKFPAHDDFFSA
jgi:hypothetical protein